MSAAALAASVSRNVTAKDKPRRPLRILVLVVVLGGWELSARLKWIDPFFFSMPSAIFEQIIDWFVNGTSQGPLLTQVWVTLEETGLGFIIGSVAGVFCGIVLGRNKLLSDVFSLYIKIANSIPRVVLGSVFVIALGLGMASKVALALTVIAPVSIRPVRMRPR